MLRPLTDDEKRTALRQMVEATQSEIERRAPEIGQIKDTARAVFWSLVASPTLQVVEAPMPSWMSGPPVEELWSVEPKVTIE